MSIFAPAILAFPLAIAAVAVCVRWVEAGLVSLLAVVLCNVTFGSNAALVGPLHVSALDVISLCLLTAGAIRLVRRMRVLSALRIVVVGYLALFLWSFLRGCAANGVLASANEARGFVGPLLAMLYFADAPTDKDSTRRYVRWYLLLGACFCIVAILAIAGLPVGVAASAHSAELADHRVLPSSATAVLAICGFIALARATLAVRTVAAFALPSIFFLAAIYLRHRTVWAMLLAGVIALGFADRRLFRRSVVTTLAAVTLIAGLLLIEHTGFDLASQRDFAESASDTGTWEWRVNGWEEFLLDPDQTASTALAGKPMGGGWWRIDPESHLLQTAPPHSEYVTEYLRVGGVGVLLVILFASRPVIALARAGVAGSDGIYPCAALWAVIALLALVYGTTYSIEPEVYALIGLANALLRSQAAEIWFADGIAHNTPQSTFAG